jgi:hypothetical protein
MLIADANQERQFVLVRKRSNQTRRRLVIFVTTDEALSATVTVIKDAHRSGELKSWLFQHGWRQISVLKQ